MSGTIQGGLVWLACNQVSTEPTVDMATDEPILLDKGATAKIRCALFSNEPAEVSIVEDFSGFVSATLYVRKTSARGTLLLTKTVTDQNDINYENWTLFSAWHLEFDLSSVETNQTVLDSGVLPIYFAIVVTTTTSEYVAAFGYGQIQDVGIVDVGDPTDPTYLNVSVDGSGNVNPLTLFNFQTGQLTLNGKAPAAITTSWTSYTPVVTAGFGTITTVGAVVGHYKVIGKTVLFQFDVTITTNGSADVFVSVTLPVTPTASVFTVAVKEVTLGVSGIGNIPASTARVDIQKYDGTYPGGNGKRFVVSGSYEAA